MIPLKKLIVFLLFSLVLLACQSSTHTSQQIAQLAPDWKADIVAEIDQSYAGWDVEIGDADNDGQNEILVTGCPNSQLYMVKKEKNDWSSRLLADNLAQSFPGMGLTVKVVDLNSDGNNEILVGTGQETGGTAFFYVMQLLGDQVVNKLVSRPDCNKSSYTHNFAMYDLDGDGIQEVISAYCGGGEIIRYDVDKDISNISPRKLYQLFGSGEESLIADVDNDGQVEYITSNSFRDEKAKIEIFEFEKNGELMTPPRIIIDGYDNKKCFYASAIIGDVDNDGENELIVGWKRKQKINKATVLGYKIENKVTPVYIFAYEDKDLDMAYFEKMMVIADADNDGLNELVISTRGDDMSEKITSEHLGHLFMYKTSGTKIKKELLADFNNNIAESSWIAVGDADNDGQNEIVVATGKGDRTKPGTSNIIIVGKD